MVYYSAHNLCLHRPDLLSPLFLLPHTVASSFRSAYKAKGHVNPKYLPISVLIPDTGFSPHEAHAHQAFFGWIMPTIRTSEFTVLQIVGLDAAVVRPTTIILKRPTVISLLS
jgi:hypothetical protein